MIPNPNRILMKSSSSRLRRHHGWSRGGSLLPVILGCAIIVLLMGAGLWMATRFAKKAVDEGRSLRSSRQQEIVDAMNLAMQEANEESEGLITTKDQLLPPVAPVGVEQARAAQWSSLVNSYLVERVLAIEPGTSSGDASTSLESILHRAVAELDAETEMHPVVESAIRIRIAESYLKLRRLDDASLQCQRALDTFERTYNNRHPYSIRARQNLAVVRLHQGQITEAALLYQQLHEIRLVENGSDDPITIETLQIASMLRSFEANQEGIGLLSEPSPAIQRLLDLELPSCRFQPIEF